MSLRLLLIDNYDSFTFNLQHLITQVAPEDHLVVKRNDEPFLTDMSNGHYDGVVIGPGPGSPEDKAYFGHNRKVILEHGCAGLPVLGICLGFQGIFHAFGGALKVSEVPVHGKTSRLRLTKHSELLAGIEEGSHVMRYHSIVADTVGGLPSELEALAYLHTDPDGTRDDALMALQHRKHPIFGLQFHPESFATESGDVYLANFIRVCRTYSPQHHQLLAPEATQ